MGACQVLQLCSAVLPAGVRWCSFCRWAEAQACFGARLQAGLEVAAQCFLQSCTMRNGVSFLIVCVLPWAASY